MKLLLQKLLILFAFLISFNVVFAQESNPDPDALMVSSELQDTLELYWRFYREDDWESLYKSLHTTQNKVEFIAERKKIKADPPVGYKEILEIALSDKMTFNLQLHRARIPGCTKILWRDGRQEWVDTYTFVDNIRDDWIVSSAVIFFVQPDTTLKLCAKNLSSLPLKIKAAPRERG